MTSLTHSLETRSDDQTRDFHLRNRGSSGLCDTVPGARGFAVSGRDRPNVIRPPYQTRTIRLLGEIQRGTAEAMLRNAPLDSERPLELMLREEPKARRPDQNAAMWAGPLRDIAEQAWIRGRQFSAEVWHEHFKREYLPENDDPDLYPELALLVKNPETYRKWDMTPKGDRVLVGSTTQLTERGFSDYMRQIEADGSDMGVEFHAPPERVPS